jgi:TrmH family RNA methyltransferase
MNPQPDVRFVLVRPRDSRNVGAACRAMKTMGFASLAVVLGPLIDPEQAGVLAHHARDVLEGALFCTDLEQAIGGASLVAGTTRRRGRDRKYFALFPEQFAERAASVAAGTVAVLFGNEDTGLTDAELARCHLAVTIPSAPAFPSLNLSHAVQVVAYELARALDRPHRSPFAPIPGREIDDLASLIVRSLAAIGFRSRRGLESLAVFFRDIVARAGLSPGEARRLGVVFRKIAGLKTGRGIDP